MIDSKSTSGGCMCLVGPHTFVPITWMCKKRGVVSHSSTEAEVVSLDAAIRMEGLPSLNMWDMVVHLFKRGGGEGIKKIPSQSKDGKPTWAGQEGPQVRRQMDPFDVDFVPPSILQPFGEAKMIVLEDNDAGIKMILKGHSPALRHVSRTHRIGLDWLFERF